MHSPPPHGSSAHVPLVSLSQAYAPGSVILPKYPEPGIDFAPGEKFAFMAGEYCESVIHSEAGRCMSVIGDQVSKLLDERTLDPELMAYMNDRYMGFDRDRLIGYAKWSHLEAVAKHARHKNLVVTHPYHRIDPSAYHVAPEVTERVNDKTHLPELVDNNYLPRGGVMSLSDVRKLEKFPVVLKWHSGASADGVAMVRSRFLMVDALYKFQHEPSVLAQEYLHIAANRSAQFALTDDGIFFVGTTTQHTCALGEYLGNTVQADEPGIEPEIAPGLWQLVRSAHREGYRGFCGIDYVRTRDGRYLILDPNFRLTGGTPAILHRNAGLPRHTGASMLRVASFESSLASVAEVVKAVGGYAWYHLLSVFAGPKSVRGYAMVAADDFSHSSRLAKELRSRGIAFGSKEESE